MTEQTESINKTQTGITITLALSMLLASLGTSIVNIALPTLAEVFLLPFNQIQAIVIGYLVSLTLSVVIAGRLGDRYGCKSMLIVGLIIFSLASLLCSVAPNLWILVASRSFQGIGAAFLMTLAMALTRHTVSKSQFGKSNGNAWNDISFRYSTWTSVGWVSACCERLARHFWITVYTCGYRDYSGLGTAA